MHTHPWWRPFELADLDEVARARVAGQRPRRIEVVPHDDAWAAAYAVVRQRVVAALGSAVLAIEHVGSTAVPGLAAKPVVDVDLTVPDPGDEAAYVPALEAAGFALHLREPAWEQHRVLAADQPRTHLHVWPPGATEPRRHLLFRDWLRGHPGDRDAYGALKLELGARGFDDGMDYNNHKAALVYDIYERALAADPAHPHDPHPRPGQKA